MTPRTAPTTLDTAALHALVIAQFPSVSEVTRPNSRPALLVPAAEMLAVALFVRDDARIRCNSLMDLGGFDRLKEPGAKKGEFPHSTLAVQYHLHSLVHFHKLTLRVELPRDAATVPSVNGIWPVAGWLEREVFDLFGVDFTGHPDLRRLMTPSDWTGHPLRKDYVYPTDYHAIPLRRDGQRFEDGPYA